MGTKVHCKSYLPGYYSMRDLNEDSSSSSWPLFYGEKTVTNGQYFNGFIPRTTVDGYPGCDKDALKQKMLEHETVFRNQVYELHRLYRIQRDMMEEVKRKEISKQRASIEPSSSSSSLQGSKMPSEDARKWHMAGFPLSNSTYGRTSILGVEIVNSPMSCTKGNRTRPNLFPSQNGSTSKDCATLDSRPLKVRKKLFDLQLPAEEYVDTEEGENLQEHKVAEISSYAPDVNPKTAPESSMKLILGGRAGAKVDCPIDASASGSCFRSSIVADLNEPIQIEELTAPSPFEFHGHTSTNGETKGMHQLAKSNAGYLGVIHDGFSMNSPVECKVNERGRISHIYEAGSRNNLSSMCQGLRQDKLPMPSHPVQGMLNHVHHPPGLYSTVSSSEDLWRDGPHSVREFSDRNRDRHNSHLEPLVASQSPGSYPFFSSPCFTSSWAHSISSWAKPKSSFTQNTTTFESPFNPAAAMDRSLQPSAHSQEPFGGKWQVNTSSRLNQLDLGSEGTMVNGFLHGPASGSKVHLPSGFDYLNCSRGDKLVSDRSTIQGFGILAKTSCHVDSKPAIDINLNEVVSSSSNEPVLPHDLNTTDGKIKPEDHLPVLPWLRPKPVRDNGDLSYLQASSSGFCHNRETVRDLNQPFTPKVLLASSDCEIMGKKEAAETQNVKKILGFPIFETVVPKNETSSLVSTSSIVDCPPENKNVNNKRKNRIIDINLECEPDEQIADEELTMEKQMKGICYIDLNSCVSDCEDPQSPSFESKSGSIKVTLEIDLEAPVFLESEDDDTPSKENLSDPVSFPSLENKAEPIQDEVLRNAADVIVAISSSCPQIHERDSTCLPSEASLADSLLWFINAVSSCAVELDCKSGKESKARDCPPRQDYSEEIDEFEVMTLCLKVTKEEDFMPKPFVPEVQIEEDAGTNTLATRSRRGQSRRGRQRRDFQRDILPGLTSLSRHEVTEDLQTFGGLMRATGHYWNSGLTRRNGTRNGGARGRRRAVVESVSTAIPTTVCTPLMQQLNNIESGLEDRSLTGWGKTTRRPRRQRCPAGNPPTVALT